MKQIAILLLITATAFITAGLQKKADNEKITKRVYQIYGEGDFGEEMKFALLTGDETAMENMMFETDTTTTQ